MGRLITEDDIEGPDWYFSDDCYHYINYNRCLKWPNSSYPCFVSIFYKELEEIKVKIEIRRWIESSIHDTVITKWIDKSYRVYYGDKEGSNDKRPYDFWDKSYEVNLQWLIFYFENSESLLAFRLKFGNIISEIIERKEDDLDKITENHRG
jgi:hypothetical protein